MTTVKTSPSEPSIRPEERADRARREVTQAQIRASVDGIVSRRPAVGLGVCCVRDGRLGSFHGRGLADIASNTPITQDTVFRIASITKLFTATAVMQLWERGLVDLDAPASDYLRAYKLIPTKVGWRSPTVRQLLTHTSGIPDVRRVSDLLHAGWTPADGRPPLLSAEVGDRLPSLAEYYSGALRVVVEPGSAFAYSNHGYATLGQIVEDVSGIPLQRYFRERIFGPLGMADTDLVRSNRVASRLATGYAFGRHGAKAVPDRDWIGAGACGAYSTPRDMGRFVTALLSGGANERGRVLESATLATMFEPHYRPDARLPGMGLGFLRADAAGHRLLFHDGILPGFNSELLVAPDDGIGAIGFTNGSSGAFAWLSVELGRLVRDMIGLPEDGVRSDVPHRPDVWAELCGRYVFPPNVADLRQRLIFGGGAEVFAGGGRLMIRLLTPVPVLYRGLPLQPDDKTDPYAFRLDLSQFGMQPVRVVFGAVIDGRAGAIHSDLGGQPWSLMRAPEATTGDAWLRPALGALAAVTVASSARSIRRRRLGDRRGVDAMTTRAQSCPDRG